MQTRVSLFGALALFVGERRPALANTPVVANENDALPTDIDVASLKALKSIAVGSYPWGGAIARQ